MIEENNSPLKARQSSRGGKSAGRATSTSSRRGGFAKSSGGRGKGGRNVGGYNVNTSFATAPAWKKPPSGGFIGAVASAPKPAKPYNIDDKGKVVMNPPSNTTNITNEGDKNQNINDNNQGGQKNTYGTKKGKLPTYREAWSSNKENINKKYKDFEAYETDMLSIKKGGKRDNEREAARKKAEKEEQQLLSTETTGGNVNISAVQFKLKGNPMYRNFGIGGKPKK